LSAVSHRKIQVEQEEIRPRRSAGFSDVRYESQRFGAIADDVQSMQNVKLLQLLHEDDVPSCLPPEVFRTFAVSLSLAARSWRR
jgi:hypothetical protein